MTDSGSTRASGEQDVVDSPTDWVKRHIDSYVASGGEDGQHWRGVETLLITTVGRKTGLRRRTALIFGRDGDDFLIVASKGGDPNHPVWYLNLEANPSAELQVGSEVFEATAETLSGEDYSRAWEIMAGIWPAYREYQAKTDRQIPVIRLRRV